MPETWSYYSEGVIKIADQDLRSKYWEGQYIKITQTTNKIFVVTNVTYTAPHTYLTVYGGGMYTLANAAITDHYYSLDAAPEGLPWDFDRYPAYASAGTGWTSAGETWTYASSDDPTYTFTIPGDKTTKYYPGMRIMLTNNGSIKYFIITKVSYTPTNTTVTVFGGTDYDLSNSAITLNYYSMLKAPPGFPLSPSKWTITTSSSIDSNKSSPAQNTWYNQGSLSLAIPIGAWEVSYGVNLYILENEASIHHVQSTLSTGTSTESDVEFTSGFYLEQDYPDLNASVLFVRREKPITLSSKTPYYLNIKTSQSGIDVIGISGSKGATTIRAVSTYL